MPDRPRARATIADDLAALGLRSGDTVLAHASLSSFGWVCCGAVAVVQALLDMLGSRGDAGGAGPDDEQPRPAALDEPAGARGVVARHPEVDVRLRPAQHA